MLKSKTSENFTEEAINRWFSFVEEYYSQNTVPLSAVFCPNAYGCHGPDWTYDTGVISIRELKQEGILTGYKDIPSAGPWNKEC